MNGEVQIYRLNDPMKWAEFDAMPDEHKVSYIKLIRQKFGATDKAIAEMLGINTCSFSHTINHLGLSNGKQAGRRPPWDKEGFLLWWHGVPVEQSDIPPVETVDEPVEEVVESMRSRKLRKLSAICL